MDDEVDIPEVMLRLEKVKEELSYLIYVLVDRVKILEQNQNILESISGDLIQELVDAHEKNSG